MRIEGLCLSSHNLSGIVLDTGALFDAGVCFMCSGGGRRFWHGREYSAPGHRSHRQLVVSGVNSRAAPRHENDFKDVLWFQGCFAISMTFCDVKDGLRCKGCFVISMMLCDLK